MKISCIALNSNLIQTSKQKSIIDFIAKKLYEIGESISLISYFDNNYNNIKNIISDNYDLVFVVGTSSPIYNHNIKDNLSKVFGDKLINSDSAYTSLSYYCKNNNLPFSIEEETEVKLPSNCIPLCDKDYYSNGFMYKINNSYIIYVPDNLDFFKKNYYAYILPLLTDLLSISDEYIALKCFGIVEKDLRSLISEYLSNPSINIIILSDELDHTIYIRYKGSDSSNLQEIISEICSKLNKFIYSTDDRSIYQVATDLLKIQKKKIALAETLTLGNITKELSFCDTDTIANSLLFNDYSNIIDVIPVDKRVIDKYGKYSVNSVYELTNSMLSRYNCDIGLFILGDIIKQDICYISVGDLDGIHVYKSKINDSLTNIIDSLSKTAIFYLIKKLKQNDLQFI